ncbi:MAG: hypothetical protein IMW91_09340 [Firmicutes bacterium]|nr:hypothetical protein [Bacillota bacterium]
MAKRPFLLMVSLLAATFALGLSACSGTTSSSPSAQQPSAQQSTNPSSPTGPSDQQPTPSQNSSLGQAQQSTTPSPGNTAVTQQVQQIPSQQTASSATHASTQITAKMMPPSPSELPKPQGVSGHANPQLGDLLQLSNKDAVIAGQYGSANAVPGPTTYLWVTHDGGNSWKVHTPGGPGSDGNIRWEMTNREDLSVSGPVGHFVSKNGGNSWSKS